MFRGLIAIFLCSVLALPWVAKVVVTTDFALNQAEIAAELCENKNRPELHCNGKCVLMQKLQLTENSNNNSAPVPSLLRVEISTFLVKHFQFNPLLIETKAVNQVFRYTNPSVQAAPLAEVFHPPQYS